MSSLGVRWYTSDDDMESSVKFQMAAINLIKVFDGETFHFYSFTFFNFMLMRRRMRMKAIYVSHYDEKYIGSNMTSA